MSDRHWEINGNLDNAQTGLRCYSDFQTAIMKVKALFDSQFGVALLNKIDFYIDNATSDSGYVPIATVVLGKIVVIKLGAHPQESEYNIAFQFAHELMHVVFRAVFGIEKPHANEIEESVCSAASLIVIHELYLSCFETYSRQIEELNNTAYAKGASIAKESNYILSNLMPLVTSNKYD